MAAYEDLSVWFTLSDLFCNLFSDFRYEGLHVVLMTFLLLHIRTTCKPSPGRNYS